MKMSRVFYLVLVLVLVLGSVPIARGLGPVPAPPQSVQTGNETQPPTPWSGDDWQIQAVTTVDVDTSLKSMALGVQVGPNHIQTTNPGRVVTYQHTVTNTGLVTDTFSVTAVSTQHWPVELLGKAAPHGTTMLPMQVGAQMTATFQVSLTIPPNTSGMTEITLITATSQLSPTVQDTASDTTLVLYELYLPLAVSGDSLEPPIANGTIVVETDNPNISDDGECSLVEALVNANDNARTYVDCPTGEGEVTIVLSAGTVYTLTAVDNDTGADGPNGLPVITSTIVISGNGATITRDATPGTPDFRIFYVTREGSLTLDNLTVRNGKASSDGGGILNFGGKVMVNNTRVYSNTAQSGGGGICNFGVLTITNTTISGNSAQSGGGLFNVDVDYYFFESSGLVAISASTISSNTADWGGGGIHNDGNVSYGFGSVTVSNSTLGGNVAGGSGDGIENWGTLQVNHSTISNSGDGIWTESTYAVTEMGNSILNSCSGPLVSDGYNLIQDITGCIISGDSTGNIMGQDPLLGLLGNNGGDTQTYALLIGSVAINAGDPSFTGPPYFDQRGPGFPRVVGGRIDIGAYESQP